MAGGDQGHGAGQLAGRLDVARRRGRRRWSDAEKAQIVGETLRPGASVPQIARHHGINPTQLYTWRRQLQTQPPTAAAEMAFVPIVTGETVPLPGHVPGAIEIVIGEVLVRVTVGTDPGLLTQVLTALRRWS